MLKLMLLIAMMAVTGSIYASPQQVAAKQYEIGGKALRSLASRSRDKNVLFSPFNFYTGTSMIANCTNEKRPTAPMKNGQLHQ
ncbi:MAG: hypothetical protein K2O24_02775 [Muribaculaceae bacterium]|nr:hypothetical protein [Muribaculaceae bacterium]